MVGEAKNGFEAYELTKALRPDVITMDVEMPRCNGLEALAAIMKDCPTPVLMLSSLTDKGAKETLKALELGAYDFMTKPENKITGLAELEQELVSKLKAGTQSKVSLKPMFRGAPPKQAVVSEPLPKSDKIIVIASSTGGPRALTALFETLPAGFNVPILIAQHMPEGFTRSLAERLDKFDALMTLEASHGMTVLPGQALVAPGQRHMLVENGKIVINREPPLHGVRPAADLLFASAAKAYGSRCIGVVLTGMGRDGAQGALDIRKAGGFTIGEAESTCTVYGMPRMAKELGAIRLELPIDQIGAELVKAIRGGARNAA